jgi:hypothetical protein
MTCRRSGILSATTILLALPATPAWAHWCNDLWASSYNLTVRPDSDASPKEVYVQNNMGYQLTNFKLTATASSGAVTLTAPTNLKVSGTLLPGEKGTWKITGGSPAKIEDVTFNVSFGSSGQSGLYPTSGAKAVMIVKNDGSLSPASPAPGLANSAGSAGNAQSRSIEFQALADWDDLNTGLDKLLNLYCAGRASWGSTDGVTQANCKDNKSTSCPTTKPTSGTGSKFDYIHLWAAGALAVRKDSLGDRLAVFRERLKCGVNDGDTGFGGFAMFVLGYLGADDQAKAFAQTQAAGSGDLATIAKAALYMMGDTSQKAAVQAGVSSSSVFVKVACGAALGIVDKDDAPVTSAVIPEVKWTEPDTSDDGKGMYAAHVLELAAYSRRGWVPKGVGKGAVSFYGESGSSAPSTGGAPGSGGASGGVGGTTGSRDAGSAGRTGNGGAAGSGSSLVGAGGSPAGGGSPGSGGLVASGGRGGGSAPPSGLGGKVGSGGESGPVGSGGASNPVGTGGAAGAAAATGSGGDGAKETGGSGGSTDLAGAGGNGGGSTGPDGNDDPGCKCNLGGRTATTALPYLALVALAFLRLRRRRS